MPAALLAPLPDGLDWAQGAALPVSALTARLRIPARLRPAGPGGVRGKIVVLIP